jgi:hypothetical protein
VCLFLCLVLVSLVVFGWAPAHSLCFPVVSFAEGVSRGYRESCRVMDADAIEAEEEGQAREAREGEGGRAVGTELGAGARRC